MSIVSPPTVSSFHKEDCDDVFSSFPAPAQFQTSTILVEDMKEVNVSGTILSVPPSFLFHLETLLAFPGEGVVIQYHHHPHHQDGNSQSDPNECDKEEEEDDDTTTTNKKNTRTTKDPLNSSSSSIPAVENPKTTMLYVKADPKLFTWILHWLRWNTLPEEELISPTDMEALHSLAILLGLQGLVLLFPHHHHHHHNNQEDGGSGSNVSSIEKSNAITTPSRRTNHHRTPHCGNATTSWKKRRILAAAVWATATTPPKLDLARLCGNTHKKRTAGITTGSSSHSSPWSSRSSHGTTNNTSHIPFHELQDECL